MASIPSIISTFIGCALLGVSCPVVHVAPGVTVQTFSTSSPSVVVVTTTNGSTSKKTIRAPYGVQTSVSEKTANGKTAAQASTTPLSLAAATKLQQQIETMQRQMSQLFADQARAFQNMWHNLQVL